MENITDWGLKQFREHYKDKNGAGPEAGLAKEDIFYYTYAVLHNPAYRKKYEQNLKRDFPRLPFYNDFFKWADWGKRLMEIHLNYESSEPYPLIRIEAEDGCMSVNPRLKSGVVPGVTSIETASITESETSKPKLRADKENGLIIIDSQTVLRNVPPEVWEYKLGNRSAVEWILDQYKEIKPKDPTIAEKFDTYRFKDYKEAVIDLIRRVSTVSVETVRIVGEMEGGERGSL